MNKEEKQKGCLIVEVICEEWCVHSKSCALCYLEDVSKATYMPNVDVSIYDGLCHDYKESKRKNREKK